MPDHNDIQVYRKVFHVGTAFFFAYIYLFYFDQNQIKSVAFITLLFLVFFEFYKIKQAKKKNFDFLMKLFYRNGEFTGFSALFYAAISFFIATFLFPKEAVIYALLLIGLCDPLANYFGIYYGRKKLCERKTLEGSIAFFVGGILVAMITTSIFALDQNKFLILVGIGLVSTITELLSTKIEDSLTVPLVSSFLYSLFII